MSDESYEIEPRDPHLDATHAALASEIRPGNTVTFAVEVDLTEVDEIRAAASATGAPMPSYMAFVVKAVALGLRDFPYANRRVIPSRFPWSGRRLQTFTRCDVAVAVERDVPGTESNAVVDVVRDAHLLTPAGITAALEGLARQPSKARPNPASMTAADWVKTRGGAALVVAPGRDVADAVVGTWSHPLGVSFGLAEPRPFAIGGAVVARTAFTLTLNFDRRVMAGAQAARFFRRIVERLERVETDGPSVDRPSVALER